MSAWEVVALNKLYTIQGGFEELDHIFLAEKIDYIEAKKEIITVYEKIETVQTCGIQPMDHLTRDIFCSLSIEELKKVEKFIKRPILERNKDELEIILDICNLISLKEVADYSKILFQILDEGKSRTCKFFISEDVAYVDILIFSALRRSRAWKKVIKRAKDLVPHLFSWHEWIKIEHKKGLFQEKMVITSDDTNDLHQQGYFEALQANNIPEIRKFFDNNILQNLQCFQSKKTACHIACENGNLELLKVLSEEYNCDLEAKDCEKMTPLFYALESRNLDLIKYLVEKKANLEHNDIVRQTPFYWACYMSSVEAVRYLYEKGCDIGSLYSSKRSPLNKAADMGRKDIVEFLVSCPEIKINETGKRGRTALQMAVWAKPERIGRPDAIDYPEIAEILLENGAEVNQKDHEGYTALITAAATGSLKSIPVLIKFGAIVDCWNNLKETPLYKASERGHLEVCKLLVGEYKADPFLKSHTHLDCIEVSITNLQYQTTKFFLENLVVKGNNNRDYFNRIIRLILYNYQTAEEIHNLISILCFSENVSFEVETIEKIIELKNESLLDVLLTNTKKKEDLKLLVEICLKKKWICGIKKIHAKFQNELSIWEWNVFEVNLDLDNEEDLFYILSNMNIDIFNLNPAHETILHLLVRKKSMQATSQICNFLTIVSKDRDGMSFISNVYLKKVNLEMIKDFLNTKNQESHSAIDLAILNKDYVVLKILEQTVAEKLQKSIAIPSYTLEISSIEEKPSLVHKNEDKLLAYENQTLRRTVTEKELKVLSLTCQSKDNFETTISQRNIVLVETEQHLEQIAFKIRENVSIIGVDMECYSDNNNQATFVCLMQISSVEEDYLIDCLRLHLFVNHHLQPIFEADNIIKVFHGCDGDLKWLKSNFDIDVVNLFDTSRAYMLLNNNTVSLGLSALTQQFLGFELDKTYQKADWRVRPLPKVMMEYGRGDSCVLLYLWVLLNSEIEKNPDLESQMNIKMARKCWKESSNLCRIKVKICN